MNFKDYEKYNINEEHRRMFQLMGSTPQPLDEQKKSKYKAGKTGKIVVKDGQGDKDYKLVVTNEYQDDPNTLSSEDMVFKIIKAHKRIAKNHSDLSPEQLIFSTRKDGRKRDVFTFMIVDKQLPPEKKEEIKKETDKLVVQVDVNQVEKEVEKEEGNGNTQPEPSTETKTESRICNIRGDKTWEYKVEDGMWYTRRQGKTKWIKLGGDKYIKARCKLDKACPDFRKTKEQNCSSTPTQKPGDGKKDNLEEVQLPAGCDTRFVKGWLGMMYYDYVKNQKTITDTAIVKYRKYLEAGYKYRGKTITLKNACSCINKKYIPQYIKLIGKDKETLGNIIYVFQKYLCSEQNRRSEDLTEGCETEKGRNKCGIVPPKTDGQYVTAVMGAYYQATTGKCVPTTGGYAPFRQMDKCKQCCERGRYKPWKYTFA